MICRFAAVSVMAACFGCATSPQPQTQPARASGSDQATTAATQPMVGRALINFEAFLQEVLAQAPAEAKQESNLAIAWLIRKTMRDGTPEQRQEMLAKLKGVFVSALTENEELGWGAVIFPSLLLITGDEGAPLALDLIAGTEPDVPPRVNRSLQELAFSALAYGVFAENAQQQQRQQQMEVRDLTIAGVRLIPPRTLAQGLAKHVDRLGELLAEAAQEADKAPANVGGPEVALDELFKVSGVLTFMTIAMAGEPLAALYDELIELEAKSAGLSADLAIITAVAVDPKRVAEDRDALAKLDRVVVRRPRIALIAGHKAQDLLAAAVERAMASTDIETQLSGLVLAKELVEAQFPVPLNEGLGSKALALRLKPGVAALAGSSDERVRQAAAEASEAIDFTADFGE